MNNNSVGIYVKWLAPSKDGEYYPAESLGWFVWEDARILCIALTKQLLQKHPLTFIPREAILEVVSFTSGVRYDATCFRFTKGGINEPKPSS